MVVVQAVAGSSPVAHPPASASVGLGTAFGRCAPAAGRRWPRSWVTRPRPNPDGADAHVARGVALLPVDRPCADARRRRPGRSVGAARRRIVRCGMGSGGGPGFWKGVGLARTAGVGALAPLSRYRGACRAGPQESEQRRFAPTAGAKAPPAAKEPTHHRYGAALALRSRPTAGKRATNELQELFSAARFGLPAPAWKSPTGRCRGTSGEPPAGLGLPMDASCLQGGGSSMLSPS
jgi:hypothetical protein